MGWDANIVFLPLSAIKRASALSTAAVPYALAEQLALAPVSRAIGQAQRSQATPLGSPIWRLPLIVRASLSGRGQRMRGAFCGTRATAGRSGARVRLLRAAAPVPCP